MGSRVPEHSDLTIDEIRTHARHLQPAGTVAQAQPDGLAAVGLSGALLLGLVARDRGAGGQAIVDLDADDGGGGDGGLRRRA